jgi:hypothetical protein
MPFAGLMNFYIFCKLSVFTLYVGLTLKYFLYALVLHFLGGCLFDVNLQPNR